MKIVLKIFFVISIILFIISFAISFVILFRPFYYWQIKELNLEENTNYTYKEIKEAYDDVINYCVLNKEFKTGKLRYSATGKAHFKDCKILFIINFIILGISLIIVIIKKKYFNNLKLFKHNLEYISSLIIIITLVILLILALIIGFNNFFELFHQVFFYGKDNWIFNPKYDEIINILPIKYFMNCTILILIIIMVITITIIIKENMVGNLNIKKVVNRRDL